MPLHYSTYYIADQIVVWLDNLSDLFDALKSAGRLHTGTTYWEADFMPLSISQLMNAERILEMANEIGYDEMGGFWDDDFDVSTQAKQELQSMLDAWASKYVDISRYSVQVGLARYRVVSARHVLEHTATYMDLSGNLDAPLP